MNFLKNQMMIASLKMVKWKPCPLCGEIVDEFELVNLLKIKKIAGYAADVVANELANNKTPLQEYAMSSPTNLLLTPHIGGFTVESRLKAEIFMAEKFVDLKLKFIN